MRELEHMVERAVIMTESSLLQPEDFFFADLHRSEGDGLIFDNLNLEDVEKLVRPITPGAEDLRLEDYLGAKPGKKSAA